MFLVTPTLSLPGRVTCSLGQGPSSSACAAVNGTDVQATGYNAGVRTEQLPAMRAFLSDASTGQWQRVVILDVGSNNGNWAKSIAPLCLAHRKAPCETVMFEPQPQFKERLTALVGELGRDVTRFEPAAAWREKGHLSFFLSHNTEASSMRSSIANRCKKCRGTTEPTLVRSLDLARYMRDTLNLPTSDRDTLSLVKIDVESGEYELLPHLIAERAAKLALAKLREPFSRAAFCARKGIFYGVTYHLVSLSWHQRVRAQ